VAFVHRATGLAAEAAFFAILSLPPLIFAGVGALGYVANSMNRQLISNFQTELLDLAARVIAPSTVDTIIAPTISRVLSRGRADVISIGFLLALWSGSRALNTFIDAIGIMYGQQGHRNVVRARLLSFGLYMALLAIAVVLVPLVLAGPDLVNRLLPHQINWIGTLYWPIVLAGSALSLVALYNISLPRHHHQPHHGLPGAALALIIWVAGSYLLRLALSLSDNSPSIYGPLAAPIAILLWLYLISLAILIRAVLGGVPFHARVVRSATNKLDGTPVAGGIINPVTRSKSFAEIVAEVKAEPMPEPEVCPGGYNSAGELFDPAGNRLHRVRTKITPSQAQHHVSEGAQLAWESCGCGGWSGCLPIWVEANIGSTLGDGSKPRFIGRHDAPTWIDLWQGDGGPVVYAHGDMKWAEALE